eukprot:548954_1
MMSKNKQTKKRTRDPSTDASQTKSKRRKKIYCICRKPDDGSAMIQCPKCCEWLHYSCINMKENKVVYCDEFFPCPFCTKNTKNTQNTNSKNAKYNINDQLENAKNVQDLSTILKTIPLHTIKHFIGNEIKNDNVNESISRHIKCNSINDILSPDAIQLIISFDSNRNKHKIVCKQWNKLCNKENTIQLRKEYQKIKQQIIGDKQEHHLMNKIKEIRSEKYEILSKLGRDKAKIEQKYKQMIEDLENLSMYQCKKCGGKTQDNAWFCKCTTCKKELCICSMLQCEAGDGHECGSEEYYCSAACDRRGVCNGCERALCSWCFENERANCDKKMCESCTRVHTTYDHDECYPFDSTETAVTLCENCFEYEDDP